MNRVKQRNHAAIFAAVVVGICGPFVVAAPANAFEANDDTQIQWYEDNGVDAVAAQKTVEAIGNGVPESISNGANPTSVSEYVEDGFEVTRSEYSDGSLSISKLEIATELEAGVAPLSVYGCVSVPGSGYVSYYNCLVSESNGAYLELGFEADYTRSSSGVGVISAVRSPYAYAFVGTAGTPTLSITKSTSNSSGPARAQAKTAWNGPLSGFTAYTYLNVNGASAWSSKVGF